MRTIFKSILGLGISVLISGIVATTAWAKVEFESTQLALKNTDQINEMVRKKIKKAQEIQAKQEDRDDGQIMPEPEALAELKAALRIVLGRPDTDGTRSNAFSLVRHELNDLNALDSALQDLTRESISALKTSSTPVPRIATYVVILENLMAEIKPEIKESSTFKKMIEEIRDARIDIPKDQKTKQLIRSMDRLVSPSVTAEKIVPFEQKK